MKKAFALFASLALAAALAGCAAQETADSEAASEAATEEAVIEAEAEAAPEADADTALEGYEEAAQLLADLEGTYVELFPVIAAPESDTLWLDNCATVVGEDMAAEVAEMLKAACMGEIYGEDAVKAYAEAPESVRFDCFFIEGVSRFAIEGSTISGLDAQGNTIFSHEYRYAGPLSLGGMMDGYVFETDDADAGEFTYFFFMPDTPASTFHTEFRYGSDLDALTEYASGPYAYWLAAGFPADYDQKLIEEVIALFCSENLAEMGEEAQAA